MRQRLSNPYEATSNIIAVSSQRDLPQYHTLEFELNMEFANGQKLALQNRFANTNPQELFLALGAPIQAAADNPFEKVSLKKITGTMKVSREAKEALTLRDETALVIESKTYALARSEMDAMIAPSNGEAVGPVRARGRDTPD